MDWLIVLSLVATGASIVMVVMLLLWVVHLALRNAAVVDVGWGLCLMLLAWYYALLGPGWLVRKWLLAALVSFWALRLASHLFWTRIYRCHEEGRYEQLRHQWKRFVALKFLFFFLAQGLVAVVLSIPFLIVCLNRAHGLSWFEHAGSGLLILAVVGEWLADAQLAYFKSQPGNRSRVCDYGLWNYSRHPNYFFESLVWIAYFLYALGSPGGWAGVISPLLILFTLLRVTGIPATEAQTLRSKGPAYRVYQETTSPFIPWFKRKPQVS